MSRSSNTDEIFSGGFASTSSSLLRMGGGWGNISGPGLFMVRTIASGTITSIFTGMVGSMFSALIYDTAALPFLVCSCAGFVLGAVGFYRDAVRKSLLYLDRYPTLLQLHLDAHFPSEGFNRWSLERLRSSNFGSWTMRSMLVVGWLSAVPALDKMVENEEQRLVEAQAIEQEKDSDTI